MTHGVAIVLVLAGGMALALAGSFCANRPGAVEAWLRRVRGRSPSEPALSIVGAVIAAAGIFVAILAVISEIWWLQGVRLP